MKSIFSRLFLLLFLISPFNLFSQKTNAGLKSVERLPTKVIYDLFLDRQNFLWLATEVGVYRYDGIGFTLFSSPEQSSLSASGLIQDDQGKIWFHNFTGQIFYIDHGKTTLLESYDSQTESGFPRLTIYKGFLVASSDRGLFLCHTKTLKSKYIPSPAGTAATSIAVIGNKLLAYGNGEWFTYDTAKGVRPAKKDPKIKHWQQDAALLHTQALGDTALLFANPSSRLLHVGISNDSVILFKESHYDDFINTISLSAGKLWVNMVKSSTQLQAGKQITGLNISDIVADREGNTWYASLDKGLFVQNEGVSRQTVVIPGMDESDHVRTMVKAGGILLLGTQHGKLYMYDHVLKRLVKRVAPNEKFGSIYKIAPVDDGNFLIGTSINTYIFNIHTQQFKLQPAIKILKQIDQTQDLLFATTANGLVITLKKKSEKLKKEVVARFEGIKDYDQQTNSFLYPKRCSALSYYPDEQKLFVAFKSALHVFNSDGLTPVTYEGKQVYSLYTTYYKKKIYIGTINNGLLVYDKGKIQKFSVGQGLLSENIVKMKHSYGKLWILSTGAVQVFDMERSVFDSRLSLSTSGSILTSDLIETDHELYLATQTGLHVVGLKEVSPATKMVHATLSVLANHQSVTDPFFEPDQNNLQFKISLPLYAAALQTYIRYSLVTGTDSSWNVTGPGERSVTFASLRPGKYTFRATAVNPELGQITAPIIYDFEIAHSWWQDEYFQMAVIACFVCFIVYILVNYVLNQRNFKKTLYRQQQSILQERQRISSEIHDDIGAGIFAVKLFADVASKSSRSETDEIHQIASMVGDLAVKIREIIWSTNTENDNLADLIFYLKFQSIKLFEHSAVSFLASIPETIPDWPVSGHFRKNVYLLVQEFMHNAIKHANASQIRLQITLSPSALLIEIADNGKGFNPSHTNKNSMGLKNASSRVRDLQGMLSIDSDSGTVIHISIPIDPDRI
ncbi:hypothetical protein DSL64_08160 [Dyadobacter luteus]|uniref:histidine kinase n=1 Tax=Dyadobacter luteus TaxID=2259619 RepID=A0A3D8YEM7_9BACT|nr:ATP-binding protein [Dyadobacter luteus]REA62883.1 hypothetical protein DSL64_08160 [Dyadobacter luteus]